MPYVVRIYSSRITFAFNYSHLGGNVDLARCMELVSTRVLQT